MKDPTYLELESFAIELAEAAGKLVLPGFGNAKAIVDKGKAGFATQMDVDAEHLMVSRIHERFPDHSILAEEGSSETRESEYTWVLDPIDGTHNYMHGVPYFSVSVGVKHNNEHVVGVVHLPIQSETYAASKGNGARCNGKPIRCSSVSKLSDAFLAVELTREMNHTQLERLKQLGRQIFRYRSMGSAAAALAQVASGAFDGYLDLHARANEWDWAGGKVLVQEAGGNFFIGPVNTVMAANHALFGQLQDLVKE